MGVSQFWSRCRDDLKTADEALLLRLQVEYDHFILRSITAILGSQRYGVWKFISVIPFRGVTESMMWHILWVFYNNGKDESHDSSCLCPYNDLIYWKAKFDDPEVKVSFRDKLLSLSPAEGQCLLETLGNMARSRESKEVDLVTMIASEMLERSFMLADNDKAMAQRCTLIFTELAQIHPFFISSLITKIKSSATRNESILEAVSEIPIQAWLPDQEALDQLTEWLINTSINHFSNRLSRIFLSKINWSAGRNNNQHDKKTDILEHPKINEHRDLAVKIYAAAKMHVYSDTNDQDISPLSTCVFSTFDGKTLLTLANSFKPKDFIEWCWRILLSLRLHSFEQQSFGCPQENGTKSPKKKSASASSLNLLPEFSHLPNIESDTNLVPISKGLENKIPFAVYITLSMTETGHRPDLLESNLELLISLVTSKNYIQFLSVLSCFVPLNIDQSEIILKNKKFISSFIHLILWDQNKVSDRLLGLIKKQLETHSEAKIKILSFWINLLFDTICFALKQSSSWFSLSLRSHPQTVQQKMVYLLDGLISLTYDDEDLQNFMVKFASEKPFDELFFKQISSSGLFSFLPFGSSQSKSCDWITPFHVMQMKYPDKFWLRCLVIKSDTMKMDQYWMDIVAEMNVNFEILDTDVVKRICNKNNVSLIPLDLVPLNAWAKVIIDVPVDHTHLPLFCYNFFKCFFSSSSHSGSVGHRFIQEELLKSLKVKISKMVDFQYSLWSTVASGPMVNFHSETTKLYRAFLKWLDDPHLHDPFVDLQRLPPQYLADVLQKIMEEENEQSISNFINKALVVERGQQFKELWMAIKEYSIPWNNMIGKSPLKDKMATSASEEEDSPKPCPRIKVDSVESFMRVTSDEMRNSNKSALASLIQHNIRCIIDDTKYFEGLLEKLSRVNKSLIQLMPEKYKNTSKDLILTGTCDKDGYDENGCSGAAKIRMCFSEATENMTISRQMEHNRLEFSKCLLELMDIPSDKSVDSLIHVEKFIQLMATTNGPKSGPNYYEDQKLLHNLLNYFLRRISSMQPKDIEKVVGSGNEEVFKIIYPPAKHLFQIFLDSISKDDRLFYLQKYFPPSNINSDHQLTDSRMSSETDRV